MFLLMVYYKDKVTSYIVKTKRDPIMDSIDKLSLTKMDKCVKKIAYSLIHLI